MSQIIHLSPLTYTHVLDSISNKTRLEIGPKSLTLNDNEVAVITPKKFIVVPPHSSCCISDPVEAGGSYTNFKLRLGQIEYRFHGEPFPLYPGETVVGAIRPLPVIPAEHALHLRCNADIEFNGVPHVAGDEWMLLGPCTFVPQPFVDVVTSLAPTIIPPGCALRLLATRSFTSNGVTRQSGEQWLYTQPGAYVRQAFEEIVEHVKPLIPTPLLAFTLRAILNHTDVLGVKRKAGEEWLVTMNDHREWIVDVTQELVGAVNLTTLTSSQYCIVLNPATIKKGHLNVKWGHRERRVGPATFFLLPGEALEGGVCNIYVLGEDQALLLRARDQHQDQNDATKNRLPGDMWLLGGPCSFTPPIEVDVVELRTAMPLKDNEGVYVRNIKSGKVRVVVGPQTYMLACDEVRWEKQLSAETESLLRAGGGIGEDSIRKLSYYESSVDARDIRRIPSAAVTYRVPAGCAVQIFHHKRKTSRVVLGPNIAMLDPWEDFNILSLSAGKPKKPDALKSIPLILGPDALTDQIQVETSDHARLRVMYAIKYHFEYDAKDQASLNKVFSVPDYIGFVSRQLASRMRGAVAQSGFDDFHRHSASILHRVIFDTDEHSAELRFAANSIVIANLDVQAIEPVDTNMGDLLMRSVQMAISISTKSVEEAARQEAMLQDQTARGRITLQTLVCQQEAEKERVVLCELRARTAAVQSTGQATAEAQARAESLIIEAKSGIESARLKADATKIEFQMESAAIAAARQAELSYTKKVQELELDKLRRSTELEVGRYQAMVDSVGVDNIAKVATSRQEGVVRLLQSIGLSTTLLTNGNNPLNLFNTATGLVGQGKPAASGGSGNSA